MGKQPYINIQNLPDDMDKREALSSIREDLGDINFREDINKILCSFETSDDGDSKISKYVAIGNGFSIEGVSPDDLSSKLSLIENVDTDVFGDSARIIVKEDGSCQIKTEDSNCFFSSVDSAVAAFSSDFRNDYEISTFRNSDDVRYSNDNESIICRPTADGDLKVVSITETLEDGRKIEIRPSQNPDSCFVRETTSIDGHETKINVEMPFSFETFEHEEHRADVAGSIDSVVNYRIDAFTEKIENVANNMSPDSTISIRTDRDMNIMCSIENKQGEGEDKFECRANMRFDSDGEFRVTDITEKIGNDTEIRIIPTNDADTCRVIEKTTIDGHDTTIRLEVKDMNFESIVEKGDYVEAANNVETNITALIEPNIDTYIERADSLAGHFGSEDSKLSINVDRNDNVVCSVHTSIDDKFATFGLNETGDKIECAICTAAINNDGSDKGDKETFTVRFDSPIERTNLDNFVFSDNFTDAIDRLADNSDLAGKEIVITEDVISIKSDGGDGYRYASVEVGGNFNDSAEAIAERVDTALERVSDVIDGIEDRIENRNETGVYDKFDIAASLTPEAADRMGISISADGNFDISVRIPDNFDGQVIKDGSFLDGKVEPGEHIRSIETERHFAVDSSDTAIVKIDTGTTSIDRDGNERENIAFRVYDIESGEMICCREYVEVSPDSPPLSVDIRMIEQEDGKCVAAVKVFDTGSLTPVAEGIIDSSRIPGLDGQEVNGDTFREFIADTVADGRIADVGLVEPSVEFDGKMYMTVGDMEAKLVEYGAHFEEVAGKISEVSEKISDIRDKIADEYRSPDFNPEHLADLRHELGGLERELSDYRNVFGGASENRDFGAINRIEKIECSKNEVREIKAALAETPKDSPKYEALQERLGELKSEIRADTGKVLQSNNILGEFVGRAIINGCNLGPRGSEIVKSIFCGRDIDLVRLIAAIRMPPDGKDGADKTEKNPDSEITPDREFHNDNEKLPDGTDTPQTETNDNNDGNPNDNENPDKNIEGTDGTEEGTDGTEEGTDGTEEGTDGTEEGTDGTEEGTDGTEEGTDGAEEGNDGTEEGSDGTEEGTDGTEEGTDGTEEGTDGTEEGTDGTEEGTDGTEEGTDGTEEGADGTEEGTDGTEEGTDGAEEGTDGTVEGTDGTVEGTDGTEESTDNGKGETTDTDPAVVGDGDTSNGDGETPSGESTDADEDSSVKVEDGSSNGSDEDAYKKIEEKIKDSDEKTKDGDDDDNKKKDDDEYGDTSTSSGDEDTISSGDGDDTSGATSQVDPETESQFTNEDQTETAPPEELASQIAESPEEFVEPNTDALGSGEGNDGNGDGDTHTEATPSGDGSDNSTPEELATSTEGDGTFEDPSLLDVEPVVEATDANNDLLNEDGTVADPAEQVEVPEETGDSDVFTDAVADAIPDDNTDSSDFTPDTDVTPDANMDTGDADFGDGADL